MSRLIVEIAHRYSANIEKAVEKGIELGDEKIALPPDWDEHDCFACAYYTACVTRNCILFGAVLAGIGFAVLVCLSKLW